MTGADCDACLAGFETFYHACISCGGEHHYDPESTELRVVNVGWVFFVRVPCACPGLCCRAMVPHGHSWTPAPSCWLTWHGGTLAW